MKLSSSNSVTTIVINSGLIDSDIQFHPKVFRLAKHVDVKNLDTKLEIENVLGMIFIS